MVDFLQLIEKTPAKNLAQELAKYEKCFADTQTLTRLIDAHPQITDKRKNSVVKEHISDWLIRMILDNLPLYAEQVTYYHEHWHYLATNQALTFALRRCDPCQSEQLLGLKDMIQSSLILGLAYQDNWPERRKVIINGSQIIASPDFPSYLELMRQLIDSEQGAAMHNLLEMLENINLIGISDGIDGLDLTECEAFIENRLSYPWTSRVEIGLAFLRLISKRSGHLRTKLFILLGDCYYDHKHYYTTGYLKKARQYYELALGMISAENDTNLWLNLASKIALVCSLDTFGQSESFNRFIELNEKIISNSSVSKHHEFWIEAHLSLANHYDKTLMQNRLANLDIAHFHVSQVLEAVTEESDIKNWASATMRLYSIVASQAQGNAEGLDVAKKGFDKLFSIISPETLPYEWAMAKHTVGMIYLSSQNGDISDNLRYAESSFKDALTIFTKDSYKLEWLASTSNLAVVLSYIEIYSSAASIADSITYNLSLLEDLKTADHTFVRALIYSNLSGLYMKLQYQTAEKNLANLEKAKNYVHQALEICSPKKHEYAWINALQNLTEIYFFEIRNGNSASFAPYKKAYDKLLKYLKDPAYANNRALLQTSMAMAVRLVYSESNQSSFRQYRKAIKLLDEIIQPSMRDDYPLTWAGAVLCLSDLQLQMTTTDTRYDQIEEYLKGVLTIAHPDVNIVIFIRASINLSVIYRQSENWHEALSVATRAYEAYEDLRLKNENWRYNVELSSQNYIASLHEELTLICLNLNDFYSLFTFQSAFKGRADVDRFAGFDQEKKLLTNHEDYLAKNNEIKKKHDELNLVISKLHQTTLPESYEKTDEVRQLNAQYNLVRKQLRNQYGDLYEAFPTLLRSEYTRSITPDEVVAMSKDLSSAILEFFPIDNNRIVAYFQGISDRAVTIKKEELEVIFRFKHQVLSSYNTSRPLHIDVWYEIIYDILIKPLEDYLPTRGNLIIAPTDILYSIPFGALVDSDGLRLGNRFRISIVSSTNLLHRLSKGQTRSNRLAAKRLTKRALCVSYPGEKGEVSYLNFANQEIDIVRNHFSRPDLLRNEDATPEQFINLAGRNSYDVIHICCHAHYDKEYPEFSGLQLNGTLSTMAIFSKMRFNNNPLVVLSGCETGFSENNSHDNLNSLAQAFLLSGAGAVIASLWKVDDHATCDFFEVFYDALLSDSVSIALQKAAESLQNSDDRNAPFYWGAFQFYGLPDITTNNLDEKLY